jgi:beta-lactamase class A
MGHRRNERFAMCSTFKWALAAAQLHMAQNGGPQLDEHVRFSEADLLSYAPVAREHLARGWMTIEEACAASVVMSDNTAANLLLEIQGGPAGVTRFLRQSGDPITQLDRNEPALNENRAGDIRDTTMPHAMVRTLKRVLLEDRMLTAANREKVIEWMVASPTGRERLRAGFPAGWRVGDKTGTSSAAGPGSGSVQGRNATNDIAIAWPPGREPIIVASYFSDSTATSDARNAAHAEIARIVAEEWS